MAEEIFPQESEGRIVCAICGESFHWLGSHLPQHSLTLSEYRERFPEAPTISRDLFERYEKSTKSSLRKEADPEGLEVIFSGVPFPVRYKVPARACLPMPSCYRVPRKGNLSLDVQDAAIAVSRKRSTWVWGPPGTGKDAVFSALAAVTRQPSLLFTIIQGADVTSWKFTRSFNVNGTFWEEGVLLRALRDGYRTEDGDRIPYLIVFSDLDRATRQQAEELRQILDSIQGRVTGPSGETWPVVPGTTIVATANSSGAGDTSGRYISANAIDASIMDRFERKIQFHHMEPDDELPILEDKFPFLREKAPGVLKTLTLTSKGVRDAIEKETIFAEWSHRTVCAWAGATEDLLHVFGDRIQPEQAALRATRLILDGFSDLETRDGVKRILDPYFKGGAISFNEEIKGKSTVT